MIKKLLKCISFAILVLKLSPCFSQETITINQESFIEYSKEVVKIIDEKNPLVLDYLDTLATYEKELDSDFSKGVLQRIFGYYHIHFTGNNQKALEFYNQATTTLKHCCYENQETVKALLGENQVLLNSGLYNFDTTYFIKGKNKVTEAYKIAEKINDTISMISCLDFFGDYNYYSAFKIQNMDTALYYYTIAEKLIIDSHAAPKYKANVYAGLTNVHRALENKEQEDFYFNEVVSISDSFKLYRTLYALYNDLAEKYDSIGDYNEAIKLKLLSYDYVTKSNNLELINRADRHMYSTYKDLNDYENALKYYEKYHGALEEMHKDQALKLQNALETKRDLLIKEDEILNLERRNNTTTRNLLLLATAFAFISIVVLLWANNSLRKKNKTLAEKNKEILLATLKGQNSERKRMAGELHDNLNTKIAAIRWQLEAIQETLPVKEKDFIAKLIFQLNDIYEDVRLISHNLMPETVETIGLLQAINDLIAKLNDSDKVKFSLVTNLSLDEKFNALSYPIYNVIFEMINNILKHSQAENAWISISKNKLGDLKISVSDDGKGFDVDQMKNGYGIKNITSRVENLNGQWSIESAPGKGTKIYIEVPNL